MASVLVPIPRYAVAVKDLNGLDFAHRQARSQGNLQSDNLTHALKVTNQLQVRGPLMTLLGYRGDKRHFAFYGEYHSHMTGRSARREAESLLPIRSRNW